MFDSEFYPTPKSLYQDHMSPYIKGKEYRDILDPSAGKGDLLKYVAHDCGYTYGNQNARLYGIEKNLQLCSILRDEKVTVLGHDFLQYAGEHHFDLVVMNPPFSCAAEHFMHAVEVCKRSDILVILPKTIWETDSRKNILVRDTVTQLQGAHVCIDSPFWSEDTERKTKVDICVVFVHRDKSKDKFFEFHGEKDGDADFSVIDQQSGLVKRDLIGQLVKNYQEAINAFRDMVIARSKIESCLQGSYKTNDLIHAAFESSGYKNQEGGRTIYNNFVDSIKEFFWNSIFNEGKFYQFMTESVRRDFEQFSKENGKLSFSEANIAMVLESLFENREVIAKKNIEEVFDLLTKYHKDNRIYIEGWKTNDKWKIKRKFILPYVLDSYGIGVHRRGELRDIDIALCALTGKTLEKIITITKAIDDRYKEDRGGIYETIESEFFKIRLYQKGTGHFAFKDEDLWNVFNLEACKLKKWLAG